MHIIHKPDLRYAALVWHFQSGRWRRVVEIVEKGTMALAVAAALGQNDPTPNLLKETLEPTLYYAACPTIRSGEDSISPPCWT